jgi:hypothetical protein
MLRLYRLIVLVLVIAIYLCVFNIHNLLVPKNAPLLQSEEDIERDVRT